MENPPLEILSGLSSVYYSSLQVSMDWADSHNISSILNQNEDILYASNVLSQETRNQVTFQQRTTTPTVEINSNSDYNILFLINILNK